MKIQDVSASEYFNIVYELIRELRPHLSKDDFLSISKEASNRDEYKIVGLFKNEECIAVMGYRILYDFVHGKHLYIDDLVVTQNKRSEGCGKQLLEFAASEAQKLGCKVLRLCTGIENKRGMHFYLKNDWQQRAVVFKKKLNTV